MGVIDLFTVGSLHPHFYSSKKSLLFFLVTAEEASLNEVGNTDRDRELFRAERIGEFYSAGCMAVMRNWEGKRADEEPQGQ